MSKKRITISLMSLIFLIYILILVFFKENNFLDLIYIKRTDTLTKIFNLITKLGNWYIFIIITLLFLIFKDKKSFKYISINLMLVTLINQLLKILFQRPRPELNMIAATGYSFPSGHSMVSMAFYGFLIYLILKSKHTKLDKIISTIILLFIILGIGFSRVYLGAHYMTDVLAGFTLAIIYLSFFTTIIEKGDKKNEKK